ncbi:MAG: hypothetical protein V4523_08090 [Pseudomonadota bacterium]
MADRDALLALAERVEGLSGPDRETDERIADALFERSHFGQIADAPPGTGCLFWWQDGHQQSALRYTASIDAAMTLVPESWVLESLSAWPGSPEGAGNKTQAQSNCSLLGTSLERFGKRMIWGHSGKDGRAGGMAKTPALALAAAALRARAQSQGDGHD